MLYSVDEPEAELIPQAVLSRAVEKIVGDRAKIIHSSDDFDAYEGVSFKLEDGLTFALRRYRGYPPGTATVYLSRDIRDVEVITSLIRRIVGELGLKQTDIEWQRRDNPDL